MNSFYAPTRFEVPLLWQHRVKVFGMGRRAAHRLADQVNRTSSSESILIFGSCGSLRSHLKAGDVFEVTSVTNGEKDHSVEGGFGLASARLFSSRRLLGSSREKQKAAEETGADLVDMECAFFLEALRPELRARVRIIRCVIDPLGFEFPSFQRIKDLPLSIKGLIGNWLDYLKAMKQVLSGIEKKGPSKCQAPFVS